MARNGEEPRVGAELESSVGVLEAFSELVSVFEHADEARWQRLLAPEATVPVALFRRNAAKLQSGRWTLEPLSVEREGELAEVFFSVRDAAGNELDRASVRFALEPDGWKLLDL